MNETRITVSQYLRTNVFMALLLLQFIVVPLIFSILLLVQEPASHTDVLAFAGGIMLVGCGIVFLAAKLEVHGIQAALEKNNLYKTTIRRVSINRFTVFIKPNGLGLANSFPIIVFANRRTRDFAPGDTITLIEGWRFKLPSPTRVPLEALLNADHARV